MKICGLFSWVGFAAVVDVVWLHAGSYGADVAAFPVAQRFVWGLAVPWFFASAMFWFAMEVMGNGEKGERGLSVAACLGKRVKSLLVPYFCWCLLGAVWSMALHGLQLHGWDMLRYVGLHPWKDPAYQPMWFVRNLFLLLCAEALVLALLKKRSVSNPPALRPSGPPSRFPRCCIFPVYVIHSMWLSVARIICKKPRFAGWEALVVVAGAVVLSVLAAWSLKKACPRAAAVLFGGR